MNNIIKEICSWYDTGLTLINCPTGFGKTYNVIDVIADSVMNEGIDKRIIFISSQIKNLPTNELREKLGEELYENNVLLIESNADSVLHNFAEASEEIPDSIKKLDEYKRLAAAVKYMNETAVDQSYKELFAKQIEAAFREKVKNLLFKAEKKRKNRFELVMYDPDWIWLGILYPSVFSSKRKVLLMTVDKFIRRNSTFIEDSYEFISSPLVKDSIIFIDEFDASKDTILNAQIDMSLGTRFDYFDTFYTIHNTLGNKVINREIYIPSSKRKEGTYSGQKLEDLIEELYKQAEDISKKYNLQYYLKTDPISTASGKSFLFQDYQMYTVSGGNENYISINPDTDNNANVIKFTSSYPKGNKNLYSLISEIKSFITRVLYRVDILASNYRERKNERPNDPISYEASIRTVLNLLGLNGRLVDELTRSILLNAFRNKKVMVSDELDQSFYMKGFRYYGFEDSDDHDLQSKVMVSEFNNTPEKILIHIAQRANVIGLSATATAPSVICNYDLNYVEQKIGDNFHKLSYEQVQKLHEQFESHIAGYEKVNVHVGLISIDKDNEDGWGDVFKNSDFAMAANSIVSGKSDYICDRYIRIVKAFREFVVKNEIQSFLCILTKHPKVNDKELDFNILKKLFGMIIADNDSSLKVDDCVFQLDGSDYDIKKEKLENILHKGCKTFVISVYQTVGAGQNLQYIIPDAMKGKLINTSQREDDASKDFDAIYLDNPTNILVYAQEDFSDKQFAKLLYQTEYLQQNGELAPSQAKMRVKSGFSAIAGGKIFNPVETKSLKSVRVTAARNVIQAIGRICRTNIKSKDIYVFADDKIGYSVDFSFVDEDMINVELKALINAIGFSKHDYSNNTINEAIRKTEEATREINKILSSSWNDTNRTIWETIREQVLRHPIYTEKEYVNNELNSFIYIKAPCACKSYKYKEENDYRLIRDVFNEHEGYKEMSEFDSRLSIYMRSKPLKEFFEKNGYATEFTKGEYVMNPVVYNNIYKGALGEVIGKYLFETMKIVLEPITDNSIYERFDYKVQGKNTYVDFKNWGSNMFVSESEQIAKIVSKAKECESDLIFIINIIAPDYYRGLMKKQVDGVTIITIPSFISIDGFTNRALDEIITEVKRLINEHN